MADNSNPESASIPNPSTHSVENELATLNLSSETAPESESAAEDISILDNDSDSGKIRFPMRPDAEICSFYWRTGLCKFGSTCKFNHPPYRKFSQYFNGPEGCKNGEACKFNHVKSTIPTPELNFLGLPIRPGEKECSYYMQKGLCKFGAGCRFNHPDPTSAGGFDASPSYSNRRPMPAPNASQTTRTSWSPPSARNDNYTYVPPLFPPTQSVLPRPQWIAYQAPVYSPVTMHRPPTFAVNRRTSEKNMYSNQKKQIVGDNFPERPGEPECDYSRNHGDCKYRSACKFHHPKNVTEKSPAISLSELGLPLRPGASICSYYDKYGICKYGPSCKYDHPLDHAPSAVDMTTGLENSMINNHAMTAGS